MVEFEFEEDDIDGDLTVEDLTGRTVFIKVYIPDVIESKRN